MLGGGNIPTKTLEELLQETAEDHSAEMVFPEEILIKPAAQSSLMRIALAQIDTIVGGLEANKKKILEYIKRAKRAKADIVAFPELTVPGYPPMDLLYADDFLKQNAATVLEIAKQIEGITALIGFVDFQRGEIGSDGRVKKYNAIAVIQNRRIIQTVHKVLLPEYDVFFETRYFTSGRAGEPFAVNGVKCAAEICEDLWSDTYHRNVTLELARKGAKLIINASASPFSAGKRDKRVALIRRRIQETELPFFYVNAVGGEDGYEGELVFDGESLAFDARGKLVAIGRQFEEELVLADVDPEMGIGKQRMMPMFDRAGEIAQALALGVKDYCRRTGFQKVVLGLSGGIDSAVVATIAAHALGKENVLGVYMPSRHSSKESGEDAEQLAKNLGIPYRVEPIDAIYQANLDALRPLGVAEGSLPAQNAQARIRGNILMAISNQEGSLVLGTGNKTEFALGYCTLYGDMAAGLGVLGDVSKMEVYELAAYFNRDGSMIPKRILTKAPTAELKKQQTDEADLGAPYSVLSPLVEERVEQGKSRKALVQMGYDKKLVEKICGRIDRYEYKRRQMAPSIKVTELSFGVGRRMPVAHGYER